MRKEDLREVYIHCKNEEEADKCCLAADGLGFRWNGGDSLKKDNLWWRYNSGTCYNFYDGIIASIGYCKENGFTVKSSKWFLDNLKNKNMETENKNVFVYIRGVSGRGEEVINTLTELGGDNFLGLMGTDSYKLYYIASNGTIVYTEEDCSRNSTWVKNHYTEIFLQKEKPKFKPFEKVLVRNSGISPWQADLYSHYDEEEIAGPDDGSYHLPHICVGGCYEECIPYEGNEYLIGIVKNPDEN